jgi:hypothetical protein
MFYDETLRYLDTYRKAGGSAHGYIIEGWYRYPTKVVPETEPYTLTNLAKSFIETVKEKR